jgi:hypothetical protein
MDIRKDYFHPSKTINIPDIFKKEMSEQELKIFSKMSNTDEKINNIDFKYSVYNRN